MKEFLTKSWVRVLAFGLIIAAALCIGFALIAVEMTEDRAQELALAHEKQCLDLVRQERERESQSNISYGFNPEYVYSSNTDACIYANQKNNGAVVDYYIKDLFTNIVYASYSTQLTGGNHVLDTLLDVNDKAVYDTIYKSYFYDLRPI